MFTITVGVGGGGVAGYKMAVLRGFLNKNPITLEKTSTWEIAYLDTCTQYIIALYLDITDGIY